MSSDPYVLLEELARAVAHLRMEVAEVRSAMDRTVRHGKVTDVDPKKQLARIEIAEKDGEPVKSPWLPYAQVAGTDGEGGGKGEYKFHNPPVKGQQMTVLSPNGELRQGFVLPFTWHDKAKSPSEKGDEHVISYGDLKIERKKDLQRTTVDKTTIEQKSDEIVHRVGNASITMKNDSIVLKVGDSIVELKSNEIDVHSLNVVVSGNTFTGMSAKGSKDGSKVMTEAGPAKQHWSLPG